jgi:hypothetical protein
MLVIRGAFLLLVSLFLWALPHAAVAQYVLGANNGTIQFATEPVGGAAAGAPVFAGVGQAPPHLLNELLTAGNGFPSLGNPAVVGGGAGPIAGFGLSALQIGPNPFGSGFVNVRALPGGAQCGVIWPNWFVSDPGVDGIASVNVSRGTDTYAYTGVVPRNALAGLFIGVRGFVPGNAVAEAGLAGTITVAPAVGGPTVYNPSVAIAGNGTGAGVVATNGTPLPAGSSVFTGFFPFAGGFTAYGLILFPINIPVGSTITVDGTLSLIADPPATLDIFTLPLDLPPLDFEVGAAVPEPSSWAMFFCGLGVTGLVGLRRWKRARRS